MHLGGLPLETAAAEANAAPHAQQARKSAVQACVEALNTQIDALSSGPKAKKSAVLQALADRLLLRRDLLRSLSAFRGKQQADLAAGAKALEALVGRVARARTSVGLADEGAEPVPGFDPNLNNHLTPPSPPRQLKVRSVVFSSSEACAQPARVERQTPNVDRFLFFSATKLRCCQPPRRSTFSTDSPMSCCTSRPSRRRSTSEFVCLWG